MQVTAASLDSDERTCLAKGNAPSGNFANREAGMSLLWGGTVSDVGKTPGSGLFGLVSSYVFSMRLLRCRQNILRCDQRS